MTGEGNSRADVPMLVVVLLLAVGIVLISSDHWRAGLDLVSVSLLGAAVLRLVLPARSAGLLVVRSRLLDAALLTGLGAAMLVLTILVPT